MVGLWPAVAINKISTRSWLVGLGRSDERCMRGAFRILSDLPSLFACMAAHYFSVLFFSLVFQVKQSLAKASAVENYCIHQAMTMISVEKTACCFRVLHA